MNKLPLVLFCFFIINFNFSQNIEVIYNENKILSKEKLESIPEFAREDALVKHKYTLKYSKGVSIYANSSESKNFESYKKTESEDNSEVGLVVKNEKNYHIKNNSIEKFYYRDINRNLFLFNVFNFNKNVFGRDKLIKWDWEITNETKVINGFLCKKALTNTFGFPYTAWFTEDIAVNAGPERFDGLPGLILYVGNEYSEFIATNVKISKELINIQEPTIPNDALTFVEYIKFVNNGVKDFKTKGNTTTTNGNTTITTIRSN